jgi:hypothetical protein
MRWVARALALLPFALLAGTRPARAQSEPDARVELTWSAPAGCPSQGDVEADVARRLGRPLAGNGALLRALAEVEAADQGFRLVLATELAGESGTRVLSAQRCEELASAASVIIALLADPHADATPAPPAPPPPPPPPPEPEDARPTAEADDEEDAPEDGEREDEEEPDAPSAPIVVRVSVRPELVADLGSMPSLAVGPGLSLGLRLDRTAIELSGSYLPPNHLTAGDRELGAIELWSAALGVCHAISYGGGTAISPCLRVEYGRMAGEGAGDLRRNARADTGVFAAALLGLRVDVPVLPALTLCAEIGAGLPLARTLFTVAGVSAVHEPATVIGRVRAGAELRF